MDPLIKRSSWTELLCKSNYSFLMGASSPRELLAKAFENSYYAIALNDFDGVYGLARFYLEWKELKKEYPHHTPKLIYSAEIHLQKDHTEPLLLQDTICLICKNIQGYKQLNQILNHSHRESKKEAYISLEDLTSFPRDQLIAIQPMRGIVRSNLGQQEFLRRKNLFSEYYFSISRHLHPSEDQWIDRVIHLSKQIDCKYIFSQDIFMHGPEKKPISDLLQSIRNNTLLQDTEKHFLPNSERYPHHLDSISKFYSKIPGYQEALQLQKNIADRVDFCFSELRYQYPKEMIPEGYTAQSFLEKISWKAAYDRFGKPLSGKIRQILFKELQLIKELGFADYFLTVWDIVRWAREQDILCQGRGSAANSSVCFVLGVTSVNPEHFDLLFERFMSKERGDPPDIDVDFEHERREEVIQYIYSRYGRKRAAMLANVITYKRKGAMRASGKALGLPESVLSKFSQLASSKAFRSKSTSELTQYVRKHINADEALLVPTDFPWKMWVDLTEELIGYPRHLGIHSGGFMIASRDLDELVAQEPASMADRTVVQWCKDDIEGLGFFKIDVLALGMLTAIRKCFTFLKEDYEIDLSLDQVPQEDGPTYQMIQKADTVGVFQIESRAQMSMLPRLKPRTFYDLVIEVAIIRPGPIQGGVIHPFLRRRQGVEPITFPDERLRPILSKTMGIPIFQEQAMRIAMAVGNFSPGEANELRKNIGAWNMSSFKMKLEPWLNRLKEGMRENKIKEEFIDLIIDQMRGFSEYGFPESHAISFAYLAYVSSYLKCHYPAAFFTAVLNAQPMGFYSPHALLQAAKRDNVQVLPVDLNRSEWDHKLEILDSENKVFAIRLGFRLVSSFGKPAFDKLLEARQRLESFTNFEYFLKEAKLYRNELTALAATNCFQVFGLSRSEALWLAEAIPIKPMIEESEKRIDWRKESSMRSIEQDFKSFHTSLREHPSSIIKKDYWYFPVEQKRLILSKDFKDVIRNQVIDVFGMLIVKQAPPSAKGMVFLTLEDEYGFINLAMSPSVYERYYPLIEDNAFICIKGKMQRSGGAESILVKQVLKKKKKAKLIPIQPKKDLEQMKENIRGFSKLYSARAYY
ncbi:MAG: error-prone DNA polymerase [Bdellovibrionales bacterium]